MNRHDEMNKAICDLSSCINLLAITADEVVRKGILSRMCGRIYDLYLINNLDRDQGKANLPTAPTNRVFTKEELAKNNGKSGAPAYVAVNGTVYDVTGSAAWGGATHFGLAAGNDLTAQFFSCHAGRQVLQGLPVVGKMDDRNT